MTATQTHQKTTAVNDAAARIDRAQALLPKVRDLRLLQEILSNSSIYPDVGDRLLEVEDQLQEAEAAVLQALEPVATRY